MDFIEPLAMETWIGSVLAGTPEILLGLSVLVIFGLAGFFKMNMLATFFLMVVFLLMFSSFISSPIILLVFIIGGLLLGLSLAKIFE